MSVFTLFNINSLKGAFMELYTEDVDNLAETLLHTTYHAMMVGEVQEAYLLMERAGKQESSGGYHQVGSLHHGSQPDLQRR